MARLITSITVRSLDEVVRRVDCARMLGAETIELRIDAFDGDPAELNRFLRDNAEVEWIITCRSVREGGASSDTAEARAALLAKVAAGTDVLVDFEFEVWKASPAARKLILNAVAAIDDRKRIILSAHNFDRPFDDPLQLVSEMLSDPHACVAKVAYFARRAAESLAALDIMHHFSDRVCAMAMGSCGLWTRVLAAKFGAWGSYCALDPDHATAPGQLSLADVHQRFRWSRMKRSTKVFGVVGDPVAHSASPHLFNKWFAADQQEAVYLPLHVPGDESDLRAFLDGVRDRPWLNIGGVSVTIPHKASALAFSGGGADSLSRSIGAANTLVFNQSRVRAFNTDCYAGIDSLCAALSCRRNELARIKVDVLGAGGVARAIVYGLQEYGCSGVIFGRTLARAKALADEFGFAAAPWDDRINRRGDVVVNATSVGMWPEVHASPMTSDALTGSRLVLDTIYNPRETALLSIARQKGIATLGGWDMFQRQASMQYALWMSEPPPQLGHSIVLIGMRGSGKTTVGRLLATRLGGTFVDVDERIIVDAGRSISEIFRHEGESGFRRRERNMIRRVVGETPDVVSVGGGAILDRENVDLLQSVGHVIWLQTDPETLWQRVSSDPHSASTRPSLTSQTGAQELQLLLYQRAKAYATASDFAIDTDGESSEGVIDKLIVLLSGAGWSNILQSTRIRNGESLSSKRE